MALNIWTQPSGYSFGTLPEQVSVSLPLPLLPPAAFNGVPPPSYDGTGHHPTVPLRNSAGSAFARYPVNSYTDGLHAMRTDLANARTVSNLVVWDQVNEGETVDPTGYSGFMYAWGQFITHELASERTGGANIDVIVPAGDTNLTPGSHIPVTRAQVAPGTGINGIAALPINDVTGWIDGSVVYGIAYPPGVAPVSGFTNPVLLREGGSIATTGKLLTSSNGQYGPIVNGSFLFGDPRGTENPDLTSIQTLFIREHNWHVDRLRAANPSWTGEQLYQRARNIVIAEEQVITYKEWLPKIIGNDAITAYTGFKPEVDASIKIEFAAAALRFGHSIVSGAQDRVDEQGNITEALTLGQAFFLTPAQFERNGGADGFLRKLASDIMNELDVHIIEDLRNLLNDPPAALDLAATNIQRGRDLGLPSLNQMRIALGFSAYTSFSQITSDVTVANALQSAYVNINDIDLWVGGLAEDRYPGAMVGPTFRAIIADQMIRLRDGDQSWYQNQPWNPTDLTWINSTTLSDIILRNTDTVHMQADAFVAVERADLISGAVPSIVARSPGTSPPPLTDTAQITFTVISGSLPVGLHIRGASIIGSPDITPSNKTLSFCIRASNGTDIADRTFSITVEANNPPTFITPAGEIAFGQQFYALDRTYINFQFEAFDLGVAAGQKLTYFISSGDGELPPGLTLSEDGLLSGYITPVLRLSAASGSGTYDDNYYDAVAFDFGAKASNGYDSYVFDNVFYDYSLVDGLPASLSRNFQFIVTLTDGNQYAQRTFRIFVIGDDTFRSDSTMLDGQAGNLFTADATYLRPPVFKTPNSLGTVRANNYLTIPIQLYDSENVIFRLETTNEEVFAVAYAVALSDNKLNQNKLTVHNTSATPQFGQYLTFSNYLTNAVGTTYRIINVASLGNGYYRLTLDQLLQDNIPDSTSFFIGTLSVLPPGLTYDVNTGDLYGTLPYQPAVTKSYRFTITGSRIGTKNDILPASRTFTISVVGEVDSVITWNTKPNLGTIDANYISTLSVSATTTIPNAELVYSIVAGKLPPGLTLSVDGEIIGRANQYTGVNGIGLITFDGTSTTFDQQKATFDRKYTFAIQAQDQYGYSAVSRTFNVTVTTPNSLAYSNIRAKPYLKTEQRTAWQTFINDPTVFTPSSIYRPNDPSFGLQSGLNMIVYAGIQTQAAAAYVGAMGLNHKKKRFQFGAVKSATAVIPGTTTPVYEVIYVEMIDPLEINKSRLPANIKLGKLGLNTTRVSADSSTIIYSNNLTDLNANAPTSVRPEPSITVDSQGYNASDTEATSYFPNSITNWQERLAGVGATERNYLPLWMRSIQPGTKQELGYTLAVPLCFCKVGSSASILLNIKYSDFDFKTIDYTIDRYTIDSVTGNTSDKYLVFRNDRITV